MASQAQKDSYNDLKPSLQQKEREVFDFIVSRADGATLREIADRFDWEMGTASGRVCGLKDKGLAVDSGFRRLNQKTKKNITVYKVPIEAARGALADRQPRLL